MATVDNYALTTITISQDGTGGTTGNFTCPVAYRACSHVPTFEGAGVSQATLTPSSAVTSADDIQLEVCVWAVESIKPGNSGVIDLVGFDELEVVTDLSQMWRDSTVGNPTTTNWKTKYVENFSYCFLSASIADPDVSSWDVSKGTNFGGVFQNAPIANPNVAGWDMRKAVNISALFRDAVSATPDVSLWDTPAVVALQDTFNGAILANPVLTNWTFTKVTTAQAMLRNATSFDRWSDLEGMDLSNMANMMNLCQGIVIPSASYDSILNAWAAQSPQNNVSVNFGFSQASEDGVTSKSALETDLGWTVIDAPASPFSKYKPASDVSTLTFDPVYSDADSIAAGVAWSPTYPLLSSAYQVSIKNINRPDHDYFDQFVYQSFNDRLERSEDTANVFDLEARNFMTDTNNWATFDFSDQSVVLRITPLNGPDITSVRILPDVGMSSVVFTANEIFVTMPEPEMIYLEINGNSGYYRDNPIFLFADDPETDAMDASTADHYFAGGVVPAGNYGGKIYFDNAVHTFDADGKGKITLDPNSEVYIKGGAYVMGHFYGEQANDIKIHGKGILSGIKETHHDYTTALDRPHLCFIRYATSTDLEITGVTMTDGAGFYCQTDGLRAHFHDLKLMGWHTNTDGLGGGTDSNYENSFLKVNDDFIKTDRSNVTSSGIRAWLQYTGALIQNGWNVADDISGCVVDSTYIVECDNVLGGERTDDLNLNAALVSVINMEGGSVTNLTVSNLVAYNQVYQMLDIGSVRSNWNVSGEGGLIDNWTMQDWTIPDTPHVSSYIKTEGTTGVIGTINLNNIQLGGELLDSDTHQGRTEITLFGGAPSPVYGV